MPRPRVREQAELLLEWGVDVGTGDAVTVFATEGTGELVDALHAELGAIGAEPVVVDGQLRPEVGISGTHVAAFLANHDGAPTTPTHLTALVEASDAVIAVGGATNQNLLDHVPESVRRQRGKTMAPIVQTIMEMDQAVLIVHPTEITAQYAGMSLPEFETFVYGAMRTDWEAQNRRQERVREQLEAASEARLVGPDTDLTMSLDGMHAINDVGELNFPPGEVFTAPVVDSVDGEIRFDKPTTFRGEQVTDVHLTIEDGVVTDYSARQGEVALKTLLDTDAGSDRIGEFGIGMNDNVNRVTTLTSFDEKMGGTAHLALGRAYDDTVGDDREQNQSAVHKDFVTDTDRIELDGEVVREDGAFVE